MSLPKAQELDEARKKKLGGMFAMGEAPLSELVAACGISMATHPRWPRFTEGVMRYVRRRIVRKLARRCMARPASMMRPSRQTLHWPRSNCRLWLRLKVQIRNIFGPSFRSRPVCLQCVRRWWITGARLLRGVFFLKTAGRQRGSRFEQKSNQIQRECRPCGVLLSKS